MKRKLLSLLLVITLLAISVSTGLPSILAADDNLIANGEFSKYSGNTPDSWSLSLKDGVTATVEENVKINDNLTANAIKFVTNQNAETSRSSFAYASTIKIERNAAYTMTYWVKVKNIKGFRTYMFEPNYIAKDGTSKTNLKAWEGENIYSFSYDNGSTRVIRTDVKHSWTIAETGTAIDDSSVSMFISRTNGTSVPLAPDYPNYTRQGEWFQVIHTFKTGNDASHEADVAYDFVFGQAVDGELWIADVKMSVVKDDIDGYFAPSINDDTLGCISPAGEQPLYSGKDVTFTAEPYGENVFDGWYVGDERVSEEKVLTFTYDPLNKPAYEARFTKGEFGIDGSFETGYTNGQLLAQSTVTKDPGTADSNWTPTVFKDSEQGGSGFYIDSHYGGTWRNAKITTSKAHSGKTSVQFSGQYGALGYKFTGLEKNTEYILSVYAYLVADPSTDWAGIEAIDVTNGDTTCFAQKANGKYGYNSNSPYYKAKPVDATKGWTKISVTAKTGDNTELIFWVGSAGKNAKLYLDDYAIARAPYKFKPNLNDANLGFISPVDGAEAIAGQDVTVTAQPLEGNSFDGWFIGDKKVSDSLEYTFKFTPESMGLTAHFTAGPTAVPNASFENGYTNGQLLAKFDANQNPPYIENAPWRIDSKWREDTWPSLQATTDRAHNGKFSVVASAQYRHVGLDLNGLEKNTDYAVSFYAYATGSLDPNEPGLSDAFVTAQGQRAVIESGSSWAIVGPTYKLGTTQTAVVCWDRWEKVVVAFNTGENENVTLWMAPRGGNAKVYFDDFSLYRPIKPSVSAGLGGSIESNIKDAAIPAGTKIILKATPLEGNTFLGWFNTADELVSANAEYSFVANSDFTLVAKFEGYNMPAVDHFAALGMDGTFENGTIGGWFADDPTYGDSVSWCSFTPSDYVSYEGTKSLRATARFRNTILPIYGLAPNTNYRLSMYVNQPDNDAKAKMASAGVIGSNETHLGSATNIFAKTTVLTANTGWNKLEFFFNTGDDTAVNFIVRYETDSTANNISSFFFDNMTLYQYDYNDELINGDFENGKTNWIGNGTAATDGSNKVLALNKDESVYQGINTFAHSSYNVSFRAKGKATVAVQDISGTAIDVKKYVTSVSYAEADGTEWTNYKFNVHVGNQEGINLVIKGGEGGAVIDDVVFAKDNDTSGDYFEYIDFESERFALGHNTNEVFSIYTATDAKDTNVLGGNKSLKFTYNPLLKDAEFYLDEGYNSLMLNPNGNYKITMNYKIAEGGNGGAIHLAPEFTESIGADVGFEHISKDDSWQTITFFANTKDFAGIKLLIANMASSTESDFYIDNIAISIAPPMVNEENSTTSYCEQLYNVIDNEGFESALSNKDWKGATNKMKIIKGEAQKGSHFLRVSADTHYVLEVDVKPATMYYFGASVRGTAASKGHIGITLDPEGEVLYANKDEEPASKIEPKVGETKWNRKAFKFLSNSDGKAYVVIDVDAGYIDIDSVMLFTEEYGYHYDPNDYTVYTPYDFNNLKSSTTVVNGGFGPQPYYDGEAGAESPSTGDSVAAPVITIIVAALAFAVVVLIKKRKEGADANA